MCFSYCVTVLSPSFLEELCELFLESCLLRVCLIVISDGPLTPGATCVAFPVVSGLPPAPAADLNLLLLCWHSCDGEGEGSVPAALGNLKVVAQALSSMGPQPRGPG